MVSVELTFDDETEAAIRSGWDSLASAGLSSAGAHTGPSNRPHLSLAVRTALGDPAALAPIAASLPLRVDLAGLVLFPHEDRTVLALAVVPSVGLLALHRAVDAVVAGWGTPLPHSAPGGWTPHVTLARRLKTADLPAALAALDRPAGATVTATATALRVWDGARRETHAVGG